MGSMRVPRSADFNDTNAQIRVGVAKLNQANMSKSPDAASTGQSRGSKPVLGVTNGVGSRNTAEPSRGSSNTTGFQLPTPSTPISSRFLRPPTSAVSASRRFVPSTPIRQASVQTQLGDKRLFGAHGVSRGEPRGSSCGSVLDSRALMPPPPPPGGSKFLMRELG